MELQPALPRPLRIACVTETYPPEVNGVSMTIARLVQGLRQRRHLVQVVRPRQRGDLDFARGGPAPGRAPEADVLVPGMAIPLYAGLRMGLPCTRHLVRLWRRQRPDVVHIATEGPLGRSALLAARALGLPTCSDFRTNFHAYSRHYGIGLLGRPIMGYLRWFHNTTHCTTVPTQALRDELHAAGYRDLAVVARGVDVARFDPALRSEALRSRWGAGPGDLVVTCVGRLAPEKNLATVIAAYAAIRARQSRARLVLVGDGPLRRELQAGCPDAVFAGQRLGAELAAHYAAADLFLFPSVTETFGNVTGEAMASGLAVVAYDYAAAARLIRDGDNGTLVPFGDDAAFVAAAVDAAADLARCRAIGARARASVMNFGWDAVAAGFESVLATVMQRLPPPADDAAGARYAPAGHSAA